MKTSIELSGTEIAEAITQWISRRYAEAKVKPPSNDVNIRLSCDPNRKGSFKIFATVEFK